MHSLTSVVYAWLRIGGIPALVFLVAAGWRAPVLGWPRQQTAAVLAAWVLLVCVPISGMPRIGEVDVVVLAALSWIALGSGGSIGRRQMLMGLWVTVVVLLTTTCGTLVLTRIPGCQATGVPLQTGMGLTILAGCALVGAWPRDTIPQRMTVVALCALVVECCRQMVGLGD